MTRTPIHLVTADEPDTAATRASRRFAEAQALALAAENAALGVWREALAEAVALRDLECANIGARQIADDLARDLERHIGRMQANHARRSGS